MQIFAPIGPGSAPVMQLFHQHRELFGDRQDESSVRRLIGRCGVVEKRWGPHGPTYMLGSSNVGAFETYMGQHQGQSGAHRWGPEAQLGGSYPGSMTARQAEGVLYGTAVHRDTISSYLNAHDVESQLCSDGRRRWNIEQLLGLPRPPLGRKNYTGPGSYN